jgi:hypothetical protein
MDACYFYVWPYIFYVRHTKVCTRRTIFMYGHTIMYVRHTELCTRHTIILYDHTIIYIRHTKYGLGILLLCMAIQ